MKKKFILLGLAATLILTICGCGKSTHEKMAEEAIEQQKTIAEQFGDEIKANQEKKQKEFEENQVKVSDAVFESSKYGKAVMKSYSVIDDNKIVITYDFTSSSDSEISPAFLLQSISAYQDGAKLTQIMTEYSKDYNTYIKSGATVEAGVAYSIRNTTSDIEFEFDSNSSENSKQTYTLKLKK